MQITIVQRGQSISRRGWQMRVGGDPHAAIAFDAPGPWQCRLANRDDRWVIDATSGTLDGAPVTPGMPVHPGSELAVGAVRILFEYTELPLPAARPLDAVETALLARIGTEGSDEHLRRVLGDHWLEHADEPRGLLVQQQCEGVDASDLIAEHGIRWCRTAIAAGFDPVELELQRGFASAALALERGEPLLDCPDALRLSPRQYLMVRRLEDSMLRRRDEVVARTLAGEHGRFVLESAHPADREYDAIERDVMLFARFSHPNIIELFDLAMHRDDGLGLVFPWAGGSLEDRIRNQPGDERLAISVGQELCAALAVLAPLDIRHNDVAPRNILVREDGHVTLAGFELATAPELPAPDRGASRGRYRFQFRYMSYEMVRGQPLTPSTDLYSLAVVLAQLSLGRHPLRLPADATDFDTLTAIRDGAYDLPTDTPLRALLRSVLVRLEDRPTLAEVAAALARF